MLSMIHTRCVSAWLVFAAATGFLTLPARAAWQVVGQIGGPISAVAVQGTTVYVAVGLRLYVYDTSDPGTPREIGSTKPLGDFISDVDLAGSRAYVTAGKDGLHILDISDPASPRGIGKWDSPGSAEGVAVAGSVAYVADGPFGLQMVEVADPAAPRLLSTAFDTFFAFDVVVNGPIAYVAGAGAGVLVLDAGDPSQPRELPIVDTPGYARGLAISSTSLYVADEWGGVRIMDVATARQPREIAAIPVQSWAFALTVSGSTLYVAAGSQGLHVYDASDPEHPKLAVYDVPWNLSWKVALLGDRAFLGVRTQGVTIIDVRNPSSPQRLGAISPLSNAEAVATSGNVAFVATGSQGVRVVDFTDVQRPRERGRGDTASGDVGKVIVVNENRAYTCGPGLRMYDTSDPAQLTLLGTARAFEGCRDLVVRGTSLYLASETELEIWDASNPAAAVLSGRIGFPVSGADRTAGVEAVDVVGSTAFVDRERGVSAIDVSNPRSPILLGSLATGSQTSDVCADGQHVYAVTGGGGTPELYVVDTSDPTQPVLVGTAPIPAAGVRVIVHDKKAYVAVGAAGVAVVDVSAASAPVLTERISLPGFAKELAFAGERLLVASSDGGLFIVEQTSTRSSTPLDVGGVPAAPPPSAPKLSLRRNENPSMHAIAADQQRVSPAAARMIVVTSTNDSGAGTLRAALAGQQVGDTITFDPMVFPPNAPATIRPQSRLPAIRSDGITVDASNAGVILDGSALSGQYEPGIEIVSRGNTIKGLQIFNFPYVGILLLGRGGNIIGGDRSQGTGPAGEANVISRNQASGIDILNPNENRIVGNLIGTDVTGRQALGRQHIGVNIFYQPGNGTDTAPDRIGGSEPWEANVIAGNDGAEVYLHNARGHAVIGNFLGTDPTGSFRVGSSSAVFTSGAAGNVIAGNVMAGNHSGVWLIDRGSHCNLVANNWIGVTKDGVPLTPDPYMPGVVVFEPFNAVVGNTTEASIYITSFYGNPAETVIIGNTIGTTALPNNPPGQQAGVRIDSAWRTFIGGATGAERNVIGGKTLGIWIKAPGLDRTFVMGNTIHNTIVGVDAGSASSSVIQGNTITNNQRGVMISAPTNRLRENSIYANGIAVTIDGDGVTKPPVITAVTLTTVRGSSCARCVVEIYSDAGMQGRWYEGSVAADATGSFSFTAGATLRGPNLTATATDAEASTSTFSAAVARPPVGPRRRSVRH